MLPSDLALPDLGEPYFSAFSLCMEDMFAQYEVVAVMATGTIVRGTGDPRSDIDLHILHAGAFRERVQILYKGVPFEIFVNPPGRIRAYFDEDIRARRPMSPHMFATGKIVFDPSGIATELMAEAKAILSSPPDAPSEFERIAKRYSASTEFEDVEDLVNRDPVGASIMLGGVVRHLVECRVSLEPGWLPRPKDLFARLSEIDPECARLAEVATRVPSLSDKVEAVRKLSVRVTGHDGFFEWKSPREDISV